MLGLLIADKDAEARRQMADLLIEGGYDVIVTNSATKAIQGVLNKSAQVLLLGSELEEFTSAELVPLLKKCNRNVLIILVADNTPLPVIRKMRKEGIFYHALCPDDAEGEEEIRQAVKCAVASLARMLDESVAPAG